MSMLPEIHKLLRAMRRSDALMLFILVALLALHLAHLGLNYAAHSYQVVHVSYELDPTRAAQLSAVELAKTVHTRFSPEYPPFRARRAAIEHQRGSINITALLNSEAPACKRFAELGRDLTAAATEHPGSAAQPSGVGASTSNSSRNPFVNLTSCKVVPFPWIRPLDVVLLVVLFGSILFQLYLARQCQHPPETGSAKKGAGAIPCSEN